MKKILLVIAFCLTSLTIAQQNEQQSMKQSNLSMLQPITVTVGGDFIVNGSFPAVKSERLDQFITTLYTEAQQKALSSLNQLETIKQVGKEVSRYALRDITLKRSNGEVVKIDLLKFRLTADFKFNPYLMNDDVIVFPSYDSERNIIDINGAVNKPVKFQFVEGDKLSDAILFAGGLNPIFENVNDAEISRLSNSGDKEDLIRVKIKDDYILKSGDRIRVLAEENQKKNYKVLVLGEVKNPGYIYVKKDGTTLSEVIEKAGGFNSNASLEMSELIRNYSSLDILKKYELTDDYMNDPKRSLLPETLLNLKRQENELAMARLSNLTIEDSLFFKIDNQLRTLKHEQLVDFTKLNDNNSDESKFLVQEGDLILVPAKFDYVYVFGQVPKVGYIKHSPGKNYKYYIEKAGGLSETAQSDGDIVVIKGKTLDWISKDKEQIILDPGDYVYVPKVVPRPFDFYLQRYVNIASIIGSVATIILLFIQFGK
jgi:protein involved in polysaccharide export with SLBB domain